jgi:hypothetical protein
MPLGIKTNPDVRVGVRRGLVLGGVADETLVLGGGDWEGVVRLHWSLAMISTRSFCYTPTPIAFEEIGELVGQMQESFGAGLARLGEAFQVKVPEASG